jgi:cold shock protein
MTTGVVKWFKPERGYGFIRCDDGSPDVFVHVSAIEASGLEDLRPQDKVEFQIAVGRGGKIAAENIKRL